MKLRIVFVTLVILALAAPLWMQAESKAEQEVRGVITELQQATMKDSAAAAAAFDKYLADDFTLVTFNGAVFTKAEIMNGWRSGKSRYESLDLSDVKIRVYGETAVVTGVVKNKGEQLGVKAQGAALFTRVLVKRDGAWQCVQLQNTRIDHRRTITTGNQQTVTPEKTDQETVPAASEQKTTPATESESTTKVIWAPPS